MEVSNNFIVQEFVPRIIWNNYGAKSIWFVSDWQIETAEFVREFFGNKSMYLNNWWWGGSGQNRGTRTPNTKVGSLYSQHKMKMAIDFHIKGIPTPDAYRMILNHQSKFLAKGITTIEDIAITGPKNGRTGWIHLDGRITNMNEMLIVRP